MTTDQQKIDMLRRGLQSMLTFYAMDEEENEVNGVIHRQARDVLAATAPKEGE